VGLLKITFIGTCSHFLGVVPFVPHRVVLPDASAFRFRMLDLPGHPDVSCFLMPHFPLLRARTGPGQDLPTAPLQAGTAMANGNIFAGIRVQVANAIGTGMTYAPEFFTRVPSITSFVPSYTPAQDVVRGGQAMCHFDVFTGTVTPVTGEADAKRVVITVTTEGAPILQVTPFATEAAVTYLVEYGEDELELLVANHGMDCTQQQENNFDFLLHYLTADEGIPRVLTKLTPGLTDPVSFTQAVLDESVDKLKTLHFPRWFDNPCFQEPDLTWDTSAACSDTRYP
jgi:hypothetical protein